MELCLINIDKLRNFDFNKIKIEEHKIEIGGYEYTFNFKIYNLKLDEIKIKGKPRKLKVRWDIETEF